MLHLLNTTIIPAGPGTFVAAIQEITEEQARWLVNDAKAWTSHIGHESTAALMSAVLGVTVPVDRTPLELPTKEEPRTCLVLQVKGRPPEGRILDREELEALGVTWRLMVLTRER